MSQVSPPSFTDKPSRHMLWRIVLENTIVGISYMRDRKLVWSNPRMAQIYGYEPGELDGQPVRILYASDHDYAEVGQMIAAKFNNHEFYTHERSQIRKDGEVIWCRISGRLLEPLGKASASVWVIQEITDKKRAEDQIRRINQRLEQTVARRTLNLSRKNTALREEVERRRAAQAASVESREKYQTLFRHVPLGLLVLDAGGEVVEVNRTLQQYLGVSTRSALAKALSDSSYVQLPDGGTTSLASLVREHRYVPTSADPLIFVWERSSRRRRVITMVATALAHGLGHAFVFTDVTEQRRRSERERVQEAALAHAGRLSLMGQMTSALAHELGQPLNVAQSYLAGVMRRLDADASPEIVQAMAKAAAHLEQAGAIIRNVRGFVSRQHYRPAQAVDLPELLNQTLTLLEHPLRSASTRVKTSIDDGLVPINGNAVEVQQVLVNLVMNAIEAMHGTPAAERWVEIKLAQEADAFASVTIADHGPGVPAELAPRLFDPYVTTKADGLGMGLMICRTIIESHGGALRLLNARRGAVFRFTLRQTK